MRWLREQILSSQRLLFDGEEHHDEAYAMPGRI